MQMGMFMMVIGWTIKLMGLADIFIKMAHNMRDIGRMINSMDLGGKYGLMVLHSKVIM